jgi:hypothetical protein
MPVTHVPVTIPDAATYTVDADDSGLIHYIPDLTADIVISLPTPKAGLWFEFAYTGAAADVQDWQLNTLSNTNFFIGGVLHVDDAPAADSIASDGNSNSKLNVLTPEAGTKVRVECTNDVNWAVSGVVVSLNAPTFADQ